jgi:tetratricopeptide (TPR) repeat protein
MKENLETAVQLYNAKRYEKALSELKLLEARDGRTDEQIYYTGLTLAKLQKNEEALMYLEQVVNSNTSFLRIYQSRMILGYIYAVTKRHKLAEFEFKKLIDAGFESVQIYSSMGYLRYSGGKIEESMGWFEKALELDPTYPNALNCLGYIYAEEEIDLDKALAFCRRAVEKRPGNAAYMDSLGWALFKSGRSEEAREILRKALKSSPGNQEIVTHMKAVLRTL